MNEYIDLREYGKLEQQVAHLSRQMDAMQVSMQSMRDILEQGRGSWRALIWLGGAAGTLGAGLSWILSHWSGK